MVYSHNITDISDIKVKFTKISVISNENNVWIVLSYVIEKVLIRIIWGQINTKIVSA